jgi:hypothetical protein
MGAVTMKRPKLNIEYRMSNAECRNECKCNANPSSLRYERARQGTRLRKTSVGQARNPPSETFVGRGKEF